MPLKISAFPKCYIDPIAGARTMSVFDWIDMARSLDADGLEMYEASSPVWSRRYLDRVGAVIRGAGFAMPHALAARRTSPTPTPTAGRGRPRPRDRGIRVCRRLGGPKSVCRVLSGQRDPGGGPRAGRGVGGGRRSRRAAAGSRGKHDVILGMENHYKDGFWKYPEFAQKKDVIPGDRQRHIGSEHFLGRAIRPIQRRSWPATTPCRPAA